jgi:hypothetical protein
MCYLYSLLFDVLFCDIDFKIFRVWMFMYFVLLYCFCICGYVCCVSIIIIIIMLYRID